MKRFRVSGVINRGISNNCFHEIHCHRSVFQHSNLNFSSLINKGSIGIIRYRNNGFFDKNGHNLYYGIYRRFGNEKPNKKSSKKKTVTPPPSDSSSHPEPAGDPNVKPDIQHIKTSKSSELSTFVVIKEKTEEAFSMVYIFGILFCCLPYTIYLVGKTVFSSSGADKIRNESFDLIKDDPRIVRILGNDVIAKSVSHQVNFLDGDGNQRNQIIYPLQGSKGDARVDVEMLQIDKEKQWRMQYVIVSTQYSVIPIVDNRPLYERPNVSNPHANF